MSLKDKIKLCLDRAVSSDYHGLPADHPIVTLNALKNIIGDEKQSPSQILLDAMMGYSKKFPQRTDDKKVLSRIAKDGIGQTVFISDLEDACQKGNPYEMEQEAARIQWVSENGLGGMEVLVELAMQNFNLNGLFTYHLYRASIFNQNLKKTWPYTRCLLKEIAKSKLPEPHKISDVMEDKVNYVPTESHLINNLAAAKRIWNGGYIRIAGIRRELSFFYSTIQIKKIKRKNIINGLEDYVKNGGKFFIELAEGLLRYPKWESKIVQLEALRFFCLNSNSENLPTISSHLEEYVL